MAVENSWTRPLAFHKNVASPGGRGFGGTAKKENVLLATERRKSTVKKIALTLVAVPALALAACNDASETANTAENNTEATTNEAVEDLGNAETAAENALDTAANLTEQAGEAIENAADAAGEAVENVTQ